MGKQPAGVSVADIRRVARDKFGYEKLRPGQEEVIRLANATPYGLVAYFYARDVGRVWRVAAALESGRG